MVVSEPWSNWSVEDVSENFLGCHAVKDKLQ